MEPLDQEATESMASMTEELHWIERWYPTFTPTQLRQETRLMRIKQTSSVVIRHPQSAELLSEIDRVLKLLLARGTQLRREASDRKAARSTVGRNPVIPTPLGAMSEDERRQAREQTEALMSGWNQQYNRPK